MDNTIIPFRRSFNPNRHMKFPSAHRHRSVAILITICLRYLHFRLLTLRSIEEGTVFYISRFHAYTFGCSMSHGISIYVHIISYRSWESTMTFRAQFAGVETFKCQDDGGASMRIGLAERKLPSTFLPIRHQIWIYNGRFHNHLASCFVQDVLLPLSSPMFLCSCYLVLQHTGPSIQRTANPPALAYLSRV